MREFRHVWGTGRSPVHFLALALVAWLGAACGTSHRATVSTVEQDVIEAVLAANDDSAALVKRGLLRDSSIRMAFGGDGTYQALVTELRKNAAQREGAFREALENFVTVNAPVETELIFARELPGNLVLVPNSELRSINTKSRNLAEAGAEIRSHFGIDGVYQVSRPGIDSKRQVALVYLLYSGQPGTGRGRFYILKHDGAKWRVENGDFFGPSWTS